jgi:hypothetical protein
LLFAFSSLLYHFLRERARAEFLPQNQKALWFKLNLNYIQAGDALCAEERDASTGVLCIVSEIGAKLFLVRGWMVCAQKKRAR